jgi:hypothetical protein
MYSSEREMGFSLRVIGVNANNASNMFYLSAVHPDSRATQLGEGTGHTRVTTASQQHHNSITTASQQHHRSITTASPLPRNIQL